MESFQAEIYKAEFAKLPWVLLFRFSLFLHAGPDNLREVASPRDTTSKLVFIPFLIAECQSRKLLISFFQSLVWPEPESNLVYALTNGPSTLKFKIA